MEQDVYVCHWKFLGARAYGESSRGPLDHPLLDPGYDPLLDPGYDPLLDPGYDPLLDPGYDPETPPLRTPTLTYFSTDFLTKTPSGIGFVLVFPILPLFQL